MTPATALQTMRIERQRGWGSLRLREIWEFRELFYFLAWRDVKVRYKQTVLGASWAILQPLLSMLVFTVFFGRLAKMPSDQVPYPVFSYAALLPWIFFSNGLGLASNSLVGSANLLTKVYFPRLIVPASAVISGLVDLAVGLMLMPLLHVVLRHRITSAKPVDSGIRARWRFAQHWAPDCGSPLSTSSIATFGILCRS